MADFLYAHSKTAISEGGYSSDPDDRGNWVDGVLVGTRYGISAPVLRAYLGRAISSSDMKNLPLSTAQDIFRANYWDKVRGDEILSNEAAYQVYDMAVNAGVSAAVKLAQKALGLPQTGVMDNLTLNAINNG